MKNHEWVDGKLLQTNKKYSHLRAAKGDQANMDKESGIREAIRELIIDISMPEQLVKLIADVLEPVRLYCGLKVSARDKKDRYTYLLGAYYTIGVDKDLGYIK